VTEWLSTSIYPRPTEVQPGPLGYQGSQVDTTNSQRGVPVDQQGNSFRSDPRYRGSVLWDRHTKPQDGPLRYQGFVTDRTNSQRAVPVDQEGNSFRSEPRYRGDVRRDRQTVLQFGPIAWGGPNTDTTNSRRGVPVDQQGNSFRVLGRILLDVRKVFQPEDAELYTVPLQGPAFDTTLMAANVVVGSYRPPKHAPDQCAGYRDETFLFYALEVDPALFTAPPVQELGSFLKPRHRIMERVHQTQPDPLNLPATFFADITIQTPAWAQLLRSERVRSRPPRVLFDESFLFYALESEPYVPLDPTLWGAFVQQYLSYRVGARDISPVGGMAGFAPAWFFQGSPPPDVPLVTITARHPYQVLRRHHHTTPHWRVAFKRNYRGRRHENPIR
jgi:hypothetical protein